MPAPLTPPVGTYNYPTAYRIGCGRIVELADACVEVGTKRPLLVTDPGVAKLAWFAPIVESLKQRDLGVVVFSAVDPNPTGTNVAAGVAAYKAGNHDGVILVGGGSAMDAGKSLALVADNPGDVFAYEDVGDNWTRADPRKVPPLIAVPTTSGTGSEVGRAGVIVDERDHSKKIIFHPKMQPELVIADPELTFALPAWLSAATGMDALAHCFEALCAPGYHPMADGIALEGMLLVRDNLLTVFRDGNDATARTHMMMAAAMGATAFQKGLGLVHALSHPLGGVTGLHHGTANAIFMPYVMEFNRELIETKMLRLARYLELPGTGYDAVMQWMLGLRRDLDMPHTLAGVKGFDAAMAKRLAPMAVRDPSMGGNPRPANADECEAVFMQALRGDLPG